MYQQIILKNLEKPSVKNPEHDIQWICDSFGFTSGRDLEDTSLRTILSLLRHLAREAGVPSDQIAEDLKVTPSRINYHIRSLMDSGFVYRQKRLIFLRSGSLKTTIDELRKDANRMFDELDRVAEQVDEAMGFRNRE